MEKSDLPSIGYGRGHSDEKVIKILNEFHYNEIYDETKQYNVNIFKANYGCGLLNYKYSLIIINNKDYIVAKEELDEDELSKLAPYCNCKYCNTFFLNPMKYFMCPCCVGCINSDFPRQEYIDLARERFLKK